MSLLYIVATPIGNLQDITYRAVRILSEVQAIACEDTRRTRAILNKYGITNKRLLACHARNEENSAAGIIKLLDQGQDIAYVSDAGTPGISDPGSTLVRKAREAGHKVIPIPGPSALSALASVSGAKGRAFCFEGFLSPREGRKKTRLKELLGRGEGFVIYESPMRIQDTLKMLSELAPKRQITVGREMTKAFEEFQTGTASYLLEALTSFKGEFSFFVHPEEEKKNKGEG